MGRNTRPRRGAGPADRLREHARHRADHVAIDALAPDGAAVRWTWGTLERRVEALARRLVALGVRSEVPVGVCATRGPDLVAAILAVWRAGGSYLPLEPALPARRLAALVADARPPVVLVDATTHPLVGAPVALRLDLDDPLEEEPPARRPARVPSESAAYVIYTSGTSGTPKGVVVDHGSLAALTDALAPRFEADESSRILFFSALSFDVHLFDLALWLGSGGVLVVRPAAALVPGPPLHATLAGAGVTHLTCTPTVLGLTPDSGLPALRALMIGGEPMPPDLVARFAPGRSLHNVYGPTEATVAATAHRVHAGEVWPPVGTPIGETTVHLLVPGTTEAAAPGERGEIALGGPGVARGYLGRADLTAARFVRTPDGARVYRTGDLGRLRDDGALVFEGRVDEQVKVRGVRVEPAEVEAVLRSLPGVREAAVVARRDDEGPTRLVAYVVADAAEPWRDWLAERLPDAFVPSAFVRLDALPLTPSGKVDRAALPAPSRRARTIDAASAARTPEERAVADIVEDLLGVSPVGRDEDFYSLGGDSLAAIRLCARLSARFGRGVTLDALRVGATVAALAARVAAPEPLATRAQERLWLLHRLEPDATDAHLPASVVVDAPGPLPSTRVRAAFRALVARHPGLRTVFGAVDGRLHPAVLPIEAMEDVVALPESDAPPQNEPFDLDRAPPWRATLVRESPTRVRVELLFHHLVVDAAALTPIAHDLAAALDGRALPEAPSPAELARRERARNGDPAWWAARLVGPARSGIPYDQPDAPRRPARVDARVPGPVAEAARRAGRAAGATPFATLLCAFAAAMHASGASEDLVLAVPHHNRDDDARATVVFLANTLPIRVETSRGGAPGDRLAAARAAVLGALAHAETPFDAIVAACGASATDARLPLAQAAFAVQDALPEVVAHDGTRVRVEGVIGDSAPYDLTVELWPEGEGYRVVVFHDAGRYALATAERLIERFLAELRALAAPPAHVVGPPLEAAPTPALRSLLARAASRWPDTPIHFVEADDRVVRSSYADLHRRAAALAARLHADAPDARTAVILTDEGLPTYVAFWACLYARITPAVVATPTLWEAGHRAYDKLRHVAGLLGPVLLASPATAPAARAAFGDARVCVADVDAPSDHRHAPDPDEAAIDPDEAAFFQCSSGTTARVKLIAETHRAVHAHVRSVVAGCGYSASDVTLAWLPPDHVTTLLMGHVTDTCTGAAQVHVRTALALARPLVLLDQITAHRVTHTVSPTFGLRLVSEALEGATGTWDLRSLRRIANGAETVSPSVSRAFLARTAAFGLDPAAMQPGFGMAETASVITFEHAFRPERHVLRARRDSLDGAVIPHEGEDAIALTGLGGPLPGVELRVVDPSGGVLPEGVVGRLEVRGEMVTPGVFDGPRRPPGAWLDTEDRAFLLDGSLYVVGRDKDTIVTRGAKLLASEIEEVAASVLGVTAAGAAAIPQDDGEALVVGVELRAGAVAADTTAAVSEAITRRLGVTPARVAVVDGLPRTSAGKLQRAELARRLGSATTDVVFARREWAPAPGAPRPGAARALWAPAPAGDLVTVLLDMAAAMRPDRAWIVAGTGDAVVDAALGGAVACARREGIDARLALSDPDDRETVLERELRLDGPEAEVRWVAGTRRAPGLVAAVPRPPAPPAAGTTWVIFGGNGGVGRVVASHLRARGVRVVVPVGVNVADREAVRATIDPIGRIDVVLHLAGVFAPCPVAGLHDGAVRGALRAKVDGTRALIGVLENRPEVELIAFGSTAAWDGAPGAAAYAAACRAQEALVESRAASGGRARVLTWGAWRDTGMSAGLPGGLGVEAALAAFDVVFGDGQAWVVGAPAGSGTPRTDAPPRPVLAAGPPGAAEREARARIAAVWAELLRRDAVPEDVSFFALGGHSLLLVQAHARLESAFERQIPIAELFRSPTVAALARALVGEHEAPTGPEAPAGAGAIAIVGMAARLPGARDVEEFWSNVSRGVVSARRATDDELRAAGVPDAERLDPRYVPVRAVLDDVAGFDDAFFGMSPREAALTDPQHRLFLEASWTALEHAGVDPARDVGRVGVFAGAGLEGYLLHHLVGERDGAALGRLGAIVGNDKDHLAPRVAYKLDLRGPAVTVQTACSTSLVAVHLARTELLAGTCELALAGGVNIGFPLGEGYVWQEGHILSPDGACRAFDAAAGGTFGGDGVGVVVLERLERALAHGRTIHAVILGSAVNNDGARRQAYTAPGVEGQVEVVRAALDAARVAPESIGYIEAHATGTALGDPVEVAALAAALGPRRAPRTLGALKPNVGHLNAAAGVAALIKAALVVRQGRLPPTPHFERPNPALELESGSFVVRREAEPWPDDGPRRAGVSAFGFGGTNAHVVIEAPPEAAPSPPAASILDRLLLVSARSAPALAQASAALADHLDAHPGLDLADVAATLRARRRGFAERAAWLADHRPGATLRGPALAAGRVGAPQALALLFPGQGAQHAGMARGIYEADATVREVIDRGAARLAPRLGRDLRALLLADPADAEADVALARTDLAQPALFLVGVAVARAWIARGARPAALLGHSVGEWAAATIAGVFRFEDALDLVAERGRLVAATPEGAMLAVERAEAELEVPEGLAIAAENGPRSVVVAGAPARIDAYAAALAAAGTPARRLAARHAFHTPDMASVVAPFAAAVARVRRDAPTIPLRSSLTGEWLTPAQAIDPAYWARQVAERVRFAPALAALFEDPRHFFVEVGPRRTLAALVARLPGGAGRVVACLPAPRPGAPPDPTPFVEAVATAWVHGVPLDADDGGRRVAPLPGTPFDRRRHWIDPPAAPATAPRPLTRLGPSRWERVESTSASAPRTWVIDDDAAASALRGAGVDAVVVAHDGLTDLLESARADERSPGALVLLASDAARLRAVGLAVARRSFRARTRLVVALHGAFDVEDAELVSLARRLPGELPDLRVAVLEHATPAAIAAALRADVGGELRHDGALWARVPTPLAVALSGPVLVVDGPRRDGARVRAALGRAGVPSVRAAATTAPWRTTLPELEAGFERSLAVRPIDAWPGLRRALEDACAATVLRFLADVGVDVRPGAAHDRAALATTIGVRPAFSRLFDAMLDVLVADAVAHTDGGAIRFARALPEPTALWAAVERDHPRFAGISSFVQHCAAHYADALAGRTDAIGVIYPGGSSRLVDAVDRRVAEHRDDRARILLLCAALRRLADARPLGPDGEPRLLRVLELGGGQGLLTWPLVAALQGHANVEIHFTDLGGAFVDDARREAKRRGVASRMRFDKLDVSRPADPSVFPPGGYDAIVAYNVLHAAPDVPAVLRNLLPLARPGGLLGVVEILRTERWDLLTWGLAEGWWYYADDVREDGPLLGLDAWERVLAREGWTDVATRPRLGRDTTDHGLLLAQAPGEPAEEEVPPDFPLAGPLDLAAAITAAEARVGPLAAIVIDPSALRDDTPVLAAATRPHDPTPSPARRCFVVLRPGDPDARAFGPEWEGIVLDRPPVVEAPGERVPSVAPAAARRPDAPYVAPRTPLEARVAAVAAEILGVASVGVTDDFVALGADSLIMLRLTDRLAAELGREIPSEAAFRGSTVERLAAAIEAPNAPGDAPAPDAASPLVCLQPLGHKPPIFFAHPATGVVFPYYGLARALGPDRPFYALQALGLDGLGPADTTVEDMARHYIAAIRTVQPRGPYHLGGYSFGCLVAHEMAVQLAEQGEPPGLVALVDEPAPVGGYRPSPLLMTQMVADGFWDSVLPLAPEYFALFFSEDAPAPAAAPPRGLMDRVRASRLGRPLERFAARAVLSGFFPEEQRPIALRQPALTRLLELFLLHGKLTTTYEGRAYPHRHTLLKATDLTGRAALDPTQGWRMLAAGGVDVHRIPGKHLTLLRPPHVERVAEVLRACLERAEGG